MPIEELASKYDPAIVEERWYAAWESAGLFQPETNSTKPSFSVTIPPPNITGALHMGHALCYSVQDVIGRYQRLIGKNVLILPGQDHAGIATQSVVIKQLRQAGINPLELGREKFVEKVWEWRKESGDTIVRQFRRLGHAFDWSRLRFTLDQDYADAVVTAFINWFDRGLIYRGKRVVNWDPVLKTSVSDIETERRLTKGKLYHVRYPFADGSGDIVIATTRPETIPADVAVAVHPGDKRYKDLVGKTLLMPLLGRELPLIADLYPDPNFGTGALKITPAHDLNDYDVGVRHNLEMPVLFDEGGTLTDVGGPYAGLSRPEARKRIVADLEEQGFLVKVEDHDIALIVSERSGEPIEPLLAEEWFCKQSELAKLATNAVAAGEIRFTPDRYEHIFLDWLENIRDWNISRRLWWGHRIPVYYTEAGTPFAARTWEEAQQKAGSEPIVRQEDDVLDTWFSSGLWPFATLGWPNESDDLSKFYPTDLLVTAQEILYLWVARMAMMGKDLAGQIPFHEVYIYATVLTEDGKRMSKSLGTGIDPLTVIETKGADALRYSLLSQTGFNQDIRYGDRKAEEARNFCNKIWNAVRFVLMNCEAMPAKPDELEATDQWLLSRLFETEVTVRKAYESYDNQSAAQALYKFFWSELCDWYIEVSKPRLAEEAERAIPQWVLLNCIEAFVTMMHPIMPHITEEVYSHLPLPNKATFLMASSWPQIPTSFHNPTAEASVERLFEITREVRSLRAALDITPGQQLAVAYYEGDLGENASVVASQAWITNLRQGKPTERSVSARCLGVDIYVPLEGISDLGKVIQKLDRDVESATADLAKLEGRLNNPQFVERAKPEVIERDEQLANDLREKIQKLSERRLLFG